MKLFRKAAALLGASTLMTTQAFAAALNPSTGDNSVVLPMIIVGAVALIAIIVFFLTGKKK